MSSAALDDLDLTGTILSDRLEGEPAGSVLRGGRVTLTRCDLSGADLRSLDLSGWSFVECTADEANLTRAQLDQTRWRGGRARAARFSDADLTDSTFEEVDLSDALFGGATVTDAVFTGCRLMAARFERSRGLGMSLTGCNLYGAHLDRCTLTNTSLHRLRLTDASLRGTDFRGSDLAGSTLHGADLTGARFQGADLAEAELGPVDTVRLQALAGATVSAGQASQILLEVAGVLVTP